MGMMKFLATERSLGRKTAFGMGMKVRDLFFDAPAVMRAVDKATRQALSRDGAILRKSAQQSMRYVTSRRKQLQQIAAGKRKRLKDVDVSKPGQPPRAIRPHPWIRRHLYFSYEPRRKNVVVGPIGFGRGSGAPHTLEYGGAVRRRNMRRTRRKVGDGGEIRIGGRSSATTKTAESHRGTQVAVTYALLRTAAQADRANRLNEQIYGPWTLPSVKVAARPFMRPALQRERSKLTGPWANSIR